MTYEKTIICLASSRKFSARCIAGISEGNTNDWIRPVSSRGSQEVSLQDTGLGTYPDVGDILRIRFTEPKPSYYQSENHVIAPGFGWQRLGRKSFGELVKLAAIEPADLWVNYHHTFNGINDKMPIAIANRQTKSLVLIEPEDLVVTNDIEGDGTYGPPKRKHRIHFRYSGSQYTLACTDPWVENNAAFSGDSTPIKEKSLLCVSLGEEFNEHAFKLIASIITENRIEKGHANSVTDPLNQPTSSAQVDVEELPW